MLKHFWRKVSLNGNFSKRVCERKFSFLLTGKVSTTIVWCYNSKQTVDDFLQSVTDSSSSEKMG